MGQLDLFPRATMADIRQAKRLLERYRWYVHAAGELEPSENRSPKEQETLDECRRQIVALERAVKLILDPEIREIVQYRYIDGNRHKLMIRHFADKMDDRTVERKLAEGIRTVAETLKLL